MLHDIFVGIGVGTLGSVAFIAFLGACFIAAWIARGSH